MTDKKISDIVHLHVHSEYSLTDGAILTKDLTKLASKRGQSAVALTDHGNMFGAVEFYSYAKDNNVKAIIGVEVYCEGFQSSYDSLVDAKVAGVEARAFHLVLLAKDIEGYHNLARVVSHGWFNVNEAGVPIVKAEHLKKFGKGIVALSACMMGEFGMLVEAVRKHESFGNFAAPALMQSPQWQALEKFVTEVKGIYGDAGFYVELIDNNLPGTEAYLDALVAVARHFALPIVATADAHYLDAEDAESHAALTAIKNDLKLRDIRDRMKNARFHLLSDEEFLEVYKKWPDAIANTKVIADQCNVKLTFGKYHLPTFDLGTGESSDETLRRLSREGLDARMPKIQLWYGSKWSPEKEQEYLARLEFELDVIIKMGFPGYFLIVQDFINWAKEHDIPVGPGRGSGAGSLVAYALRITDLDPLPFNLIFERFLNPERVSMPDFDVDFCQDRRDEVIKYVTERYGAANVAQITTFGKMKAKAAIKDVGRVLEMGYGKVDRISKLIPKALDITLAKALDEEPRIMEEARKDPMIEDMINLAMEVEGMSRHTSVHAAGIVIADGGMENLVPVYRDANGSLITQYEMKNAEKVGLVKFDFLGLKTLTVIQNAVKKIRARKDPKFEIADIPLYDKEVYDLISTGQAIGVFQLETTGMRQLLPKLQPSTFEDIIALVALFRPGPLGAGMVDDFIDRKHGRKNVEYILPQLEPILKETYGTIVYQEQVQKIAAILASYSLGEADLLRRAMGKKKPEEMAKQKERFVSGCVNNKIDPKIASDLFDMMAMFAEYGFNKSHSAAYGLVSYQTAYLKTHFPAEFMSAIMTCDLDDTDKIVRYVQDCRAMKMKVTPPNINTSTAEFEVVDDRTISFGLGAIKGLGLAACEPILKARATGGVFKGLTDLARRVNLQAVGKKTVEVLINAGAMDCFGQPRAELRLLLADLVKFSENIHSSKSQGIVSLFDDDSSISEEVDQVALPDVQQLMAKVSPADIVPNQDLQYERTLLGTFLSGHPLDLFQADIKAFSKAKLIDLPNLMDKGSIPVVCYYTGFIEKMTKTERKMWVLKLEDNSGEASPAMFEDKDTGAPPVLPPLDQPVVVVFKVGKGFNGGIRMKVENICSLEEWRSTRLKSLEITIAAPVETDKVALKDFSVNLRRLQSGISHFSGKVPVKLMVQQKQGVVEVGAASLKVRVCNELLQILKNERAVCPNFKFQTVSSHEQV